MPILYHHKASVASRFIRVCFGEVDFEAELVEENVWEKRPEFLKINPAGNLPVCMTDNNHALCGPHIIAEWLDESFGVFKRDRRLLAEDPFRRAEIRRLMEWFLIKFEHDVARPLVRERVLKLVMPTSSGGGAPDPKMLRAGRANIRQHMKYLSWLAGSRAWLAGDRLSYADLAAAAAISMMDYLGEVDWNANPQAKDWYQRVKSRPSFRPLLTDRIRNLPPVSHYADLDF
ncbi:MULTISPECIES: glutathione S-transferase family protein [unclassified Hoeflea]|uniref:glutathione S-transferase family protein n=1 Tax=unclassified Hoeflea TaxID=2614931 RepID=UPI002AFFA6DB|nr:glutathione S-transferase family protein [Hoeflea sp.]